MKDSPQITPRILTTTDFSRESETAFYHALAAAVARQGRLTLLHTGSESRQSVPWDQFPGVRETLSDWQLLPKDAPRTAVAEQLKLGVAKMAMRDSNPRLGITDYLRRHPTDLLVMATEGRHGLARVLHPSVAESVSFITKSPTLMLPKNGRTFIDSESGTSSLHRVICALDHDADPQPALTFLGHWLPALAGANVQVTLLQAAPDVDAPPVQYPAVSNLTWHTQTIDDNPTEALIAAATSNPPDLVVMNARSPLKLMGRMRGSQVDCVLKALGLPVLSIPKHRPAPLDMMS